MGCRKKAFRSIEREIYLITLLDIEIAGNSAAQCQLKNT